MKEQRSSPASWPALARGVEDGMRWMTAKAPLFGAVNGYVEIPEDHPWYGQDYEDIDVECHGGLTYGEGGWIGFDTLHYGDWWPGSFADYVPGGTRWTPEMVIEETRNLARAAARSRKEKRVTKYTTKPVQIEAVQWTGENTSEIEDFAGLDVDIFYDSGGAIKLEVHTLEGIMTASPGDFIIKGLRREFYPCKPDVFHAKYQEIQ